MTVHIEPRALEAGVHIIRGHTGQRATPKLIQAICDAVDKAGDEVAHQQLLDLLVDKPIPKVHVDAVGALALSDVSVLVGTGPERSRLLRLVAEHHVVRWTVKGAIPRVLLLAATRKAANMHGGGADTVHHALGWDPVTQTFEHDLFNPLDAELIIVDYADMLDRATLTHLLAARGDARVVLTRDPTMLGSSIPPSVMDVEMDPETPATE